MKPQPKDDELRNLLPQSMEAEMSVLSIFFSEPKWAGGVFAERRITESHFHSPNHKRIFTELNRRWAENLPIDMVIVLEDVRRDGRVEQFGGTNYVTLVATFETSRYNLPAHLDILEDKRILREIHQVCSWHRELVLDNPVGSDLLLAFQEAAMALSVAGMAQSKPFKTRLMDTLDSIINGDDFGADIVSGIQSLDRIVKMRKGNQIVIAGETKSGKTALAGTILDHAAVEQKKRCCVFSLEMSDVELIKRQISTRGRVNIGMMGRNPMEHELQGVQRGFESLSGADIEIEHSIFDLGGIVAKARQLHAKKPLDLIILDYIQLVEFSTGRKGETRQEIVAQISRTCKRLAGELQCVIIALSQLNDDGKLRESRAIGQDANAIIVVEKDENGGRTLFIPAQRNGECPVSAEVQWLPQFTKFENK